MTKEEKKNKVSKQVNKKSTGQNERRKSKSKTKNKNKSLSRSKSRDKNKSKGKNNKISRSEVGGKKEQNKSQKGEEIEIKKDDLRDNIIEQIKLIGDNNNLTTDDIFRLLDLYFYKEFYAYRHLHESFDKFIDDTIPRFFTELQHIFSEIITEERCIRHKFKFENVTAEPPKLSNNIDPMFPADARHLALPYSMTIYADVTQIKEVTDINVTGKNNVITTIVGTTEKKRPVMIVPTMIRSKYCNLNIYKEETRDECKYDPGGYFVINGSEKVVICQDRMIHNHPLVFIKKNSNVSYHVVQVNSKSPNLNGMMQALSIKMKKDNVMIAKIPILHEVNVMIIFRALGIESDRDIIEYCAYDKTDYHMVELLRASLDNCINDNDERELKIQTQEEAIDYLITKMKIVKKYIESNIKTKMEQKKLHLMDLLKTSFLPHVESLSSDPYREKAYYLGYMINKLLNVQLGREDIDNRDSYCKKRVDNIRELFEEIMIQQYKNNIAECNKQFMARMGDEIDTGEPYNVIHQFKAGTFEQGFKASLMLGNWPRKKGVSQMLQRFSYLQLLSFLSRIDSQSGTQSSSKLTKPRQIDPSSVPFLCVSADSEILMSDNATVKLIKDMKNGDSVKTVYKDDLRELVTPITNYFSKMADDVIEIETISGRKLKCTKDHPILIQESKDNFVMKKAGELKIDDKVIVRHTENYLVLDKETVVIIKKEDITNKDYINELDTLQYLDRPIEQARLEILARLIGANVTKGHLGKIKTKINKDQYDAYFCVNEEIDAFDIYDDIQKLGFGTSSISRCNAEQIDKENDAHAIYNTFKVAHGGAFGYLLAIMGTFIGDKTMNKHILPDWLLNGNNRIKREFLSGFNGGDGSYMCMQYNGKEYNLTIGEIVQTTTIEYLEDCTKYMNNIQVMHSELGINGKIIIENLFDKLNKKRIHYIPEATYDNIGKIGDVIGYRYCMNKRRKCAPIIEYIKYTNTLINIEQKNYYQHDNEIIEYGQFERNYYIKDLNLAIPIKSIKNVENQMVYDFTTILDSHSFIANSIVIANCVVSTPEHSKIGLIKHMTLIGSLTIGDSDNTELVKEFIINDPDVKRVYEVPVYELKNMFKIMLNGEWLGVIKNKYNVGDKYIDNPVLRFYGDAKVKKLSGLFNPQMTSIALDHTKNEIRFCTDSGRLYRPVIRINGDNEMMLTKEMINKISLRATDVDKITDWDEFYMQAPYPIEFIDSEEQPFLMIAEDHKILNEERKKIINTTNYKFDGDESKIVNRYDNKFFLKFDAIEIHPSVLLGELPTNIPFCNRNCAPRNIFQYAQGRQGMGIYNTVYRSRTDISYVLYSPEVPIVNTRTSKYTYTDILPPGSNAVVAIACYTGLKKILAHVVIKVTASPRYGGQRCQIAGKSY